MRSACEGCAECVGTWCGAYAQGVRSLSVGACWGDGRYKKRDKRDRRDREMCGVGERGKCKRILLLYILYIIYIIIRLIRGSEAARRGAWKWLSRV